MSLEEWLQFAMDELERSWEQHAADKELGRRVIRAMLLAQVPPAVAMAAAISYAWTTLATTHPEMTLVERRDLMEGAFRMTVDSLMTEETPRRG